MSSLSASHTTPMRTLKVLIPSVLSSLRLAAALLFPFTPERFWFSLICVAGLSDVLDGWLARRWQAVTWQGALIDAIADKIFVLTVLLVLITRDKIHLLWLPLVLSRDLLVLYTAITIAIKNDWALFKEMSARTSGKLATLGQFTLFLAATLFPGTTTLALIFASTCSCYAAVDYGRLFVTELAARKSHHG